MTITPIGMFKGSIAVGDIVKVAEANDITTLTTYTFSGVSLGDARVGDYILICAAGFTSGTAGRTIASIQLDGVEAAYLSAAYASGTQTSRNGLVAATGNATGTIVVTFVAASHWGSIVVYRCRDIDPYPVDAFFDAATPLTGDLLIPARGIGVGNSSNAVNNSTATWTGLTKDSNVNATGQRTQSTASLEFLTEQNKLTAGVTWSSTTAPVHTGVSFGPKGYYAPASLTYLGKQQIISSLTNYSFNAFNAGTNSLGAANPGRVIYIAIGAGQTATLIRSVTVAGKVASIVTPIISIANNTNVACIVLNTETSGDIVVAFPIVMAECSIGVWVGYGYDTETFFADQFTGTNNLVTSSLRCMGIAVSHHPTVVPTWNSGFNLRDSTTQDSFGDIQWLGPSTGVLANPFYIGGTAAQSYALFQKFEASAFTGQCDFLGYQGNATDLTTYTFTLFSNGTNSLGPAAADRVIYIAIEGGLATARDVVSVTVAGVTATKIAGSSVAATYVSYIYSVALPTGTNGDIVVTMSGSCDRLGIGVWYTRGFDINPLDTVYTQTAATVSVNTVVNGVVISGQYDNAGAIPLYTTASGAAHLTGVIYEGGMSFAHSRNTKGTALSVTGTRTVNPASMVAVSLMPTSVGAVYPMLLDTVGTQNTSLTSHTVNLPTGMQVGEMCLIVGSIGINVHNYPAGWTVIPSLATLTTSQLSGAYRIIDGTEGSSITVTTSAAQNSNFLAHRISNPHPTQAPEGGFSGWVTATTTADPPAVTASWGAANNLWIAGAVNSSQAAVTTWPDGYEIKQTSLVVAGGLYSAGRRVPAATENPSAFVYGVSQQRRGWTIAIRGK